MEEEVQLKTKEILPQEARARGTLKTVVRRARARCRSNQGDQTTIGQNESNVSTAGATKELVVVIT